MFRSGAINSWLSPRAASIFGLVWVVVAAVLLRPQAPWWGYVSGKPNELGIGYAATAAVMAAVPGLLLWQLSKPVPAVVIKHYGVTAAPVTTAEAAAAHRDLTDAASSIMPLIMMTGYPGFLASELLPRILQRAQGARALCIVQAKFAAMARARLAELDAVHPNLHLLEQRRVYIVHGDIVSPGLGLPGASGSGTASGSGMGDSESQADSGKPAASVSAAADATSPTGGKSGRKRRSASASGAARSPDAATGSGAGAGPGVSRGQPSPRRASLPINASGQPLSSSYSGMGTHAAGVQAAAGSVGSEDILAAIASRVTEIFHAAAVYDLSVSAALGDAVNVRGTRNVLAFAKRCHRLHCLHYVSTWCVEDGLGAASGRRRTASNACAGGTCSCACTLVLASFRSFFVFVQVLNGLIVTSLPHALSISIPACRHDAATCRASLRVARGVRRTSRPARPSTTTTRCVRGWPIELCIEMSGRVATDSTLT